MKGIIGSCTAISTDIDLVVLSLLSLNKILVTPDCNWNKFSETLESIIFNDEVGKWLPMRRPLEVLLRYRTDKDIRNCIVLFYNF